MISSRTGARAVLSLGRIYCDLVFRGLDDMPQLGRELFARDFALTPGGGALITAAHLAAAGRPAAVLARFGTDPLSLALQGEIDTLGVDLRFLDQDSTAGPQLTVAMVHGGDRAFLSRRAGHARPASFESALVWPEAAHLHIAEYATLHEMTDAISTAKSEGLTVSLDPSWDADLIGDPMFFERTAGADIFLPNLEEARELTHCDDAHEAIERLSRHFPVVALKCGADGALLAMNGSMLVLPTPVVEVIDTTGAGDAFNSGFIDAWLDGRDPQSCLAAAIGAGTRSVQAPGGTGSLRSSA